MPANHDVDDTRLPSQGPGLLTAIRRHPLIVLASIIVVAALGVLATVLLPTKYQATSQIVLGNENDASVFKNVQLMNPTAMSQSAAQIMRSQAVFVRTSVLLHHKLSPSDVANDVSVAPAQDSPQVTITATASSAGLAQELANAEGRAYLDTTKDEAAARAARTLNALSQSLSRLQSKVQSLNAEKATLAAQVQKQAASIVSPAERAKYVETTLQGNADYQALQNQASELVTSIAGIKQTIQETQIDAQLTASGVDTLLKATRPTDPTSPNMKRNVVLGAAIGLLVGAALAWRRLGRETAVEPEQVSVALGAPLLGTVHRSRELRHPTRVVDLSPGRPLPDDLRVLASSLLLHMQRQGLAASVISSAHPGEGKTVLALNLAAAASSAGHNVALVDGDVRRAALTHAYGLQTAPGLVDLLAHPDLGDQFDHVRYAPNRTLPLLPVGSRRDGAEPLTMSGLPAFRREDGTVPAAIVDSPSVFEDPVTLWLASQHAGLVVVVSAASSLDDLRTVRSRADLAGVSIVGFILNDFRPRSGRARGRMQRASARQERQRHRAERPVNRPAGVPATTH